eukprot:2165470-Pyramimonas_sp.AAC.1
MPPSLPPQWGCSGCYFRHASSARCYSQDAERRTALSPGGAIAFRRSLDLAREAHSRARLAVARTALSFLIQRPSWYHDDIIHPIAFLVIRARIIRHIRRCFGSADWAADHG